MRVEREGVEREGVEREGTSAGRILKAAIGVVVVWVGVLLVLDLALAARQRRGTTERIGESLQATATVEDSDLALLRGRMLLHKLAIRRDDLIGRLAIDVDEIRCELPPFGLALVDRECRELEIDAPRIEISTAALFKLRAPRRKPIRARHVVIDHAVLVFSPNAFLPSLGSIEISIDHAEASATTFRTPLSWLLNLDVLRARIDLPAGITLVLAYKDGKMSAAGTLFGSTPVEIPVTLPIAETAIDARAEVDLLVTAGKDIAERLVAKRAEDWIRSKLR